MKRILFCTPAPLTKSLGAAKVVVELAEEMRNLDWDCHLISLRDLAQQHKQSFHKTLHDYLHDHADEYDVVDYDHEYLPYPRSDFSQTPLFVARSVLLNHHLETISIPHPRGLKPVLGKLIHESERQRKRYEMICTAQKTIEEADLINVSNFDDKAELIKRGIAVEKIVVIPYGISRSRRFLFDKISSEIPIQPRVAFVGTYDYRKGAKEFPEIVQSITKQIPEIMFRLLGVKGMFSTEQEIKQQFPKRIRHKLEVIPQYAPEELPKLLSTCSVGIFPSYLEGFGFGVLEMLAASVPVIAYNTPGPPMMLHKDYLVPRGDVKAMCEKIIELLSDNDKLSSSRTWAKQCSQNFQWENSAKTTNDIYSQILEERR